ncbi:hypothetical protein MPSEU_000981100 [Mayamaea pseudoterrestris]|nr:hypothetical protein MPSEU_000981100 [Mayamaea pseudoterrestris]
MDQENTYNAAIALNNMGIALLERKCYRQAWETLHDAVQVACKGQSESVCTYLNKAFQRQCNPDPSKAKSPLHLEIISDNADSITCIHATQINHSAIAIRLEAFDSTKDVSVDTAVILHNFAISALYLALAYPVSRITGQLLQNCLKSLLKCQSDLSTRYTNLDMDDDFGLVQKVFVVAVVSTNSLLQVFGSLGAGKFDAQIHECQTKLHALKTTLTDLDQHAEIGAVAAAAA